MQERVEQTKAAMLFKSRAFAAQQLASFNLSDEKAATDYYDKLLVLVASKYDWSKLQPQYEQIYFDFYTEEELDGILTFYKTPIGRALLAKTPEASARILRISKQQSDALAPEVQKLNQEFVSQLKIEYDKANHQ